MSFSAQEENKRDGEKEGGRKGRRGRKGRNGGGGGREEEEGGERETFGGRKAQGEVFIKREKGEQEINSGDHQSILQMKGYLSHPNIANIESS